MIFENADASGKNGKSCADAIGRINFFGYAVQTSSDLVSLPAFGDCHRGRLPFACPCAAGAADEAWLPGFTRQTVMTFPGPPNHESHDRFPLPQPLPREGGGEVRESRTRLSQ